jgi:hypothetical protein
MKACTKCGEVLPFEMFYKSKSDVSKYQNRKHADKNGFYYRCKGCIAGNKKVSEDVMIENKKCLDEKLKINILSDVDAAYLAALIDGEGSISMNKTHTNDNNRNTTYCLRVKITNTFPGIMDWVALVVGHGNVCKAKKYHSHYKQSWTWSIVGRRAIDLLYQIYPYLRIKKLQAEVVFEYAKTITYPGQVKLSQDTIDHRAELKNRLTVLNN